jgi:hypothetical protein
MEIMDNAKKTFFRKFKNDEVIKDCAKHNPFSEAQQYLVKKGEGQLFRIYEVKLSHYTPWRHLWGDPQEV